MPTRPLNTWRSYLPKFKRHLAYLNSRTALIWVYGVLFTRLATGTWLGNQPILVAITILSSVYVYMHLGHYSAMLTRFPAVWVVLYLGHTILIQTGDILLSEPIVLSWKHLLLVWATMNLSFLLRGDDYPFARRLAQWPAAQLQSAGLDLSARKVAPLRKRYAH